MCKYCEDGMPTGASIETGDESAACAEQIAESLRDAIRSLSGDKNDLILDDIDRCINELVRRANPKGDQIND